MKNNSIATKTSSRDSSTLLRHSLIGWSKKQGKNRVCWTAISTIFYLCFISPFTATPSEAHSTAIIDKLLSARSKILESVDQRDRDDAIFLAFWDFDGTLISGDCTEGVVKDGNQVYSGLAQVCIENGLSERYAPDGGFRKFWDDYRLLDEQFGHWLAYPYIPQMLCGADKNTISAIAREHFRSVLGAHYFDSSVEILKALELAGIENHVISASADIFVDAATHTLGIPQDRFNGIEVAITANGRLTHDLIAPVTWAEGKVSKLLEIVCDTVQSHPGCPVVVLCGFGNSFSTDGPFLEFISQRTLPGEEKGLAVMINGGDTPKRYTGRFLEVSQGKLVDLRGRTPEHSTKSKTTKATD